MKEFSSFLAVAIIVATTIHFPFGGVAAKTVPRKLRARTATNIDADPSSQWKQQQQRRAQLVDPCVDDFAITFTNESGETKSVCENLESKTTSKIVEKCDVNSRWYDKYQKKVGGVDVCTTCCAICQAARNDLGITIAPTTAPTTAAPTWAPNPNAPPTAECRGRIFKKW